MDPYRVIYRTALYTIVAVFSPDLKPAIRIDSVGGLSQYTTKYNDGRIGYDFPERIPEYAKKLVASAYREIEED